MKRVYLSPSLICMDLCNLEKSIREAERAGVDMLHVDILDGYFSPSMPIGLEVVQAVRKITDLPFDCHVMTKEPDFFVDQLLKIGVQKVAFQIETARHAEQMLAKIKSFGAKAGLAVAPETSLTALDYLHENADYFLHMMINPGFASSPTSPVLEYSMRKLNDIRKKIGEEKDITVDGHVSTEKIPEFVANGATTLVLGTRSMYAKGHTVDENIEMIRNKISEC